jgi:hypothetical protein
MDNIKVFLCYAREDMAVAKRLYQDLQRCGITPWLDIEDLQPGQIWDAVIADVITQSSYVLVLLSQYSLNKTGHFRKDLNRVLDKLDEVPPHKSYLIPVRLEACEPQEDVLRQLQWCDLFADYHKGVSQILQVIHPDGHRVRLRSEPVTVAADDQKQAFDLDDHDMPRAYVWNDFEDLGDVVVDHATGLMWQKAGSEQELTYQDAQTYVEQLNQAKFAGFADWRLPTIPELMSLIEPERQANGLFLNPMFETRKHEWDWSADRLPESGSRAAAWFVRFTSGPVNWYFLGLEGWVRSVRS